MIKDKIERFGELDALRGIAATLVVFFHYTLHRSEYNTYFKLGTTGVDLFFMISGFVIFMSVHRVTSASDFIINRISRLYPTYWACATFSFLLIFLKSTTSGTPISRYDIENFLGNLSMFQFYLNMPDLEGSYWTMIVEMLFYISILILYIFELLKYIKHIGLMLSLSCPIVAHYFYDVTVIKNIFILFPLMQFIPLFFAGILFYKIYTEKKGRISNYSCIVICFFSQISLFPIAGRSRDFITYNEYIFMLLIFFVLFVVFVNNGLKFIANSATLFLGKISFSLYLIHSLVSSLIINSLTEIFNINFWVASVCVAFPFVVCLATFITYCIEVPGRNKMREKLRLLKRAYSPST